MACACLLLHAAMPTTSSQPQKQAYVYKTSNVLWGGDYGAAKQCPRWCIWCRRIWPALHRPTDPAHRSVRAHAPCACRRLHVTASFAPRPSECDTRGRCTMHVHRNALNYQVLNYQVLISVILAAYSNEFWQCMKTPLRLNHQRYPGDTMHVPALKHPQSASAKMAAMRMV